MLYNRIQEFVDKLNTLSNEQFCPSPFIRRGKTHYTQALNVEEGVKYSFGNEYSRRLLERLSKCSEVEVKVYGRPVIYNEDTNSHEYQLDQWITIDCYSSGDGEYPDESFTGANIYEDRCTIYIDDIDYFLILPTQNPKNAVRFQP